MGVRSRIRGLVLLFVIAVVCIILGCNNSQQPPPQKFLSNVPASISVNGGTCTVADSHISVKANEQVAWTVQGNTPVVVFFSDNPFLHSNPFNIAVGPAATTSGGVTDVVKDCVKKQPHCDYKYTISMNSRTCADPRVIVSR
jgi:hypothetical protein